jgi:hypothetical protein
MGNSDPRTWPRLAGRYRVVGIAVFALAAVAYPVLGLAPALCLVVVSAAYLLSTQTAAATGQLSAVTRVVIWLAILGFAVTLVWSRVAR